MGILADLVQAKRVLAILESRLQKIEDEIEATKYPTPGQLETLALRSNAVRVAREAIARLEDDSDQTG